MNPPYTIPLPPERQETGVSRIDAAIRLSDDTGITVSINADDIVTFSDDQNKITLSIAELDRIIFTLSRMRAILDDPQ